jgi:hypothetical protein
VTLYILCQLKSTWVKFTHCRLVNYKLVGRFRIYYFMNIFLLVLTMKFIFYKFRFHFTVVVNLKNLQISVLASLFFIFCSPVDILPVNLICCLVNFLLARPFSFIGHFFSFIHFKWRRFFICNWFDWCFILIQSDLNFSLCWHLASQTHCHLVAS